jgi:hypothetical protein
VKTIVNLRCSSRRFYHAGADRRGWYGPICPVVHVGGESEPAGRAFKPLNRATSFLRLGDRVKHIVRRDGALVATCPGKERLLQGGKRGRKKRLKRAVALRQLLLVLGHSFNQHGIGPGVHVRVADTQRDGVLVDQTSLAARCEAALVGGEDAMQVFLAFLLALHRVIWCGRLCCSEAHDLMRKSQ